MSGSKGADEMYCRSCGSVIKKAAEICPECGVPNEHGHGRDKSSSDKASSGETIYCRSCGEQIKKRAELCPNCGTRNLKGDSGQSANTTASSEVSSSPDTHSSSEADRKQIHDPSEYSTTVSDRWYWGVAASIVLWILGFIVPIETVAGFFFLVGWVMMPASIYFDAKWLRANTEWNPNTLLWGVGAAIWLLNFFVGAFYLFRRYETVSKSDTPSDTHNGSSTGIEDGPLAELRRRYSEGEIDDVEFENKVEKILATEDEETAEEMLIERQKENKNN